MARLNKAQKKLNRTDRLTPRDVEIAGTFAEKPKIEKKPPREATRAELFANNNSMVEFGKMIGNLKRWVPLFKEELEEMNRGKRGRRFEYSDLMIIWILAVYTAFDSSFRMTAGFVEPYLNLFGLHGPSYSRLNERANQLAEDFLLSKEPEAQVLCLYVSSNVLERARRAGIDSSGLNLSSTNAWKEKKWKVKTKDRGWLKLHALCDVDTGEIIAALLTTEKVGDAPLLKTLVKAAVDAGHKIDTLYADGAYSTDENWKFLCQENSFKFITSFTVATKPTNNGCLARGEAARLWCSLPYNEWVKRSGYGTRWKCECTFSDLKRIFPETVTARSLKGMVRQVIARLDLFNIFKDIRAKNMGVTGNGIVVG